MRYKIEIQIDLPTNEVIGFKEFMGLGLEKYGDVKFINVQPAKEKIPEQFVFPEQFARRGE